MMLVKLARQVLIIALVFATFTTHGVWGEADCHHEKILVFLKCKKTIKIGVDYVQPTSECRRTVQSSDMACVCRIITDDEEFYVSVSKLVRLARECGRQVPAGDKCGSWTVPPPLSPPPSGVVHA
ncbi:hypothetical protein EJB05_23789, partial [Eragrostis curvula]